MSKLAIEWLAVFEEIYQTRNVSRAAEQLGIAQATASIALAKLRAHYGDKLFTRTTDGMQPTTFAEDIRPSLKKVLDLLEQTQGTRKNFDPARSTRVFRVCMTDIRQMVMLPTLVNHLKGVAPEVRIEASLISPASARAMEEGRLELAIGYMPQLDTGFMQRTLLDEDFVCMVAANHPRIGRRLGLKVFLAEGQILVSMSGTGPSIVEKTVAEQHLKPNTALRVSSFLGVARIVAQTDLFVVVPRSLGQAFSDREEVRLLTSPIAFPPYSVRLYWHERVHGDPGNAWLRQLIAGLFSGDRRPPRG